VIGGVKLIENPYLNEIDSKSARVHRRRKWMRKSYHARIQKKWDKRFGFIYTRPVVELYGAIYAHPKTIEIIRGGYSKYSNEGRVFIGVDPAGKDKDCTVKARVVDGVLTVEGLKFNE